jgi:hypothetical protein
VHRDGVDYVLVLLIARHNVVSGTTTIHDADRRLLGEFTLTDPFDAALVHDARVYHGVTPVEPLDPAAAAYRDVLVVTFRGEGSAHDRSETVERPHTSETEPARPATRHGAATRAPAAIPAKRREERVAWISPCASPCSLRLHLARCCPPKRFRAGLATPCSTPS